MKNIICILSLLALARCFCNLLGCCERWRGQVGILSAGVNWRLVSLAIAQLCPFVRSQSASLTADLEPGHQKVKSQVLFACCCSVSHGMGRDDPVVPVYPLQSFLSIRLAAALYHIRRLWSKAQEPGSGTLLSI